MRGQMPPDPAIADDQQALARNLALLQPVAPAPGAVAAPRGRTRITCLAAGKDQHHRVFGHRDRIHIADDAQRDLARIQRGHIHRVIADPVARHDLQPVRLGDGWPPTSAGCGSPCASACARWAW